MIDSATLLEGLLRQCLASNLYSLAEVKAIAAHSLSAQLRSVIGSAAREDRMRWHGLPFDQLLVRLEESGKLEFASPLLDKLAVHVADWRVIETIEDRLLFAKTVEPYIEEPRHAIVPSARGWRLRQFDYLNSYILSEGSRLVPSKVNTFTGAGLLTWEQTEMFEDLINKSNVNESDFQDFFKRHPEFLLGGRYCRLHSQIILLDDSGNELIPDFFAEHIGSRFADIIEIKKPTAKLITGRSRRRGFSAHLTQALNQAREYRNVFDDVRTRKQFHHKYGFQAFRPRLCVIIGRDRDYVDYIERIRIEDEYKNPKVQTFDDILKRAKQMAVIT